MDETLKLKLNISRDVHSEFMRKVLGKTHYESVFGDHSLPSIYTCPSRDSVSSTPSSTSPTHSVSNSQNNCPNTSVMSVFEFCVVCDSAAAPMIGSPGKRRNSFPSRKQENELNRKFTFSSLLTELNDYSATGSTADLSATSRSTAASPLRFDQGSSTNSLVTTNLHLPPMSSSSSSSSHSSPMKHEKELFDGMIRLEASRAFDDFKSGCSNHLILNISSISTRLDDSSFQSAVENGNGSSVSSSLSTPTVASQSPNLSRSTSEENLMQLFGREHDSFNADSELMPPRHLYPPAPVLQMHAFPFQTGGSRQPVIAKRTPKIEKMISEVKQRANSPSNISHNLTPRSAGGLLRSASASNAHFFDHAGISAIQSMSLQSSSSLVLDGIAGNENKYVINNPHSKNRPKPLYSLFPTSVIKKNGKSGSSDTIQTPPVPRLTSEEMINNRKLMARKMRDVCVNKRVNKIY